MINVPEIKLKNILDGLLSYVVSDWANHVDKTETYLYRIFNGVVIGTFDFYVQSQEILLRTVASPRKLETRLEFDRERAALPTIFINTPNDRLEGENSISFGENDVDGEYYTNSDGTTTSKVRRTFGGEYELMITSSNEHETLLIYYLLKSLFISGFETLSFNFDGTLNYAGKKLMPNYDIIPTPLYIRVAALSIQYTMSVPKITITDFANSVTFDYASIIEE